ncbi:MAG: hypothetical protein SGI97_03415 [candidate division Zixibacteria bacterium]|nr:hypothetical protein [candidate division Zixibacteria bacterium]
MTIDRRVRFSLILACAGLITGCSDKSEKQEDQANADSSLSDKEQIQATFTEAIERLRYNDKSVLFDNEFEYIQEHFTLDDYIAFPQIVSAEADSTDSMVVSDVTIYGRDSADVSIVVVMKGPSGNITRFPTVNRVYHHRGRWIQPTVGTIDGQLKYDSLQYASDSAAEAEEDEDL